jgi:hypothetical protein
MKPTPGNKYEQRYCAFIDFLGFTDAIEKETWTPDQIHSAMAKAANVAGGEEEVIRVTQFSDSLILSAPVNEDWAFLTLVSTAFFLTIELVQHNVLIRGGIAKGDLYHQDNMAFGPAFIRAYHLEQAANTPRIILDSELAEKAYWPDSMDNDEINHV